MFLKNMLKKSLTASSALRVNRLKCISVISSDYVLISSCKASKINQTPNSIENFRRFSSIQPLEFFGLSKIGNNSVKHFSKKSTKYCHQFSNVSLYLLPKLRNFQTFSLSRDEETGIETRENVQTVDEGKYIKKNLRRKRNDPIWSILCDRYAPECHVFMSNLPYEVTWFEVKQLCNDFGKVVFVKVLKEQGTDLSRGQARVIFDSPESAFSCVNALNKTNFRGRDIIVLHDIWARSMHDAGKNGHKVWIGNLHYRTSSREVKTLLGNFGRVLRVDVPKALSGPGNRGYMIAYYETREMAEMALEALDGVEFGGRNLIAREYSKRTREGMGNNKDERT